MKETVVRAVSARALDDQRLTTSWILAGWCWCELGLFQISTKIIDVPLKLLKALRNHPNISADFIEVFDCKWKTI